MAVKPGYHNFAAGSPRPIRPIGLIRLIGPIDQRRPPRPHFYQLPGKRSPPAIVDSASKILGEIDSSIHRTDPSAIATQCRAVKSAELAARIDIRLPGRVEPAHRRAATLKP